MRCQFLLWYFPWWRWLPLLPGCLRSANQINVLRFFVTIALVVLALITTGLLLSYFDLWQWSNNVLWVLLFIAVLTLLIHLLNVGALKLSNHGSVLILLTGMVVKLLLGGSFVLYLIYIYPTQIVSTVLAFFSLFLGLILVWITLPLFNELAQK